MVSVPVVSGPPSSPPVTSEPREHVEQTWRGADRDATDLADVRFVRYAAAPSSTPPPRAAG
ncbi:hypothetical protein NOCARDAX2BIS_370006 [Nocardioides sp. AX2bis]|nr:hypothetical protein NOCARDAX2BIS_370006 [Nocardioides sp. AX2bis]